ncbi:TPA: right-handed parallel beta-helix repeat-containing protein [Serratia marcescens]|nr:right-handed parallel beta-helix repeat-containing protein [Serratia marcescens]HEJ9033215.1 right-handed parallel beta-helix repeat-containing protein [Serratia marcescens]
MERRELVKSMLLAAAGASVAGISSSAESSGEATSNSVGFDKLRPGSFKNDGAKTIKLSPEMFFNGRSLDGTNQSLTEVNMQIQRDSYDSFDKMLQQARVLSSNNIVEITLGGYYRVSKGNFELPSNCHIIGGGTVFLDNEESDQAVFKVENKQNFILKNITISSSKTTDLWGKTCNGIEIRGCSNFELSGLNISYRTDAISISDSSHFRVENCLVHKLGEEGIAIRACFSWLVFNNDIYEHNGDGILLKTSGSPSYDGKIICNRIFSATDAFGLKGTLGGGITLNDEKTGSSTTFSNLLVSGNSISNTSYGIAFTNIQNLKVVANDIDTVVRFGIIVDNALHNNPQQYPIKKTIVSGNTVKNTGQAGVAFFSANGIDVQNTIISDNILERCGLQESGDYPAISSTNATISANRISDSRTLLNAMDSIINANFFGSSLKKTAGENIADFKLGGSINFIGNIIENKGMGHIRLLDISNLIFIGNQVELSSPFSVFHLASAPSGTVLIKNNHIQSPAKNVFTGMMTAAHMVDTDFSSFGNKVCLFGVPKYGEFKAGDRAIQRCPEPGMPSEWVCIESGSPGIWSIEKFANISCRSTPQKINLAPSEKAIIKSVALGAKSGWAINSLGCSLPLMQASLNASLDEDGVVTITVRNIGDAHLNVEKVIFNVVINRGY